MTIGDGQIDIQMRNEQFGTENGCNERVTYARWTEEIGADVKPFISLLYIFNILNKHFVLCMIFYMCQSFLHISVYLLNIMSLYHSIRTYEPIEKYIIKNKIVLSQTGPSIL